MENSVVNFVFAPATFACACVYREINNFFNLFDIFINNILITKQAYLVIDFQKNGCFQKTLYLFPVCSPSYSLQAKELKGKILLMFSVQEWHSYAYYCATLPLYCCVRSVPVCCTSRPGANVCIVQIQHKKNLTLRRTLLRDISAWIPLYNHKICFYYLIKLNRNKSQLPSKCIWKIKCMSCISV